MVIFGLKTCVSFLYFNSLGKTDKISFFLVVKPPEPSRKHTFIYKRKKGRKKLTTQFQGGGGGDPDSRGSTIKKNFMVFSLTAFTMEFACTLYPKKTHENAQNKYERQF